MAKSTKKSQKARKIFLPHTSFPLIPVNGTQLQHLVSGVLSDTTLTGATSIHAEPGVGKSVAVGLATLEWAKDNPKCITVLVSDDLTRLGDFFKVQDKSLVPLVANSSFRSCLALGFACNLFWTTSLTMSWEQMGGC